MVNYKPDKNSPPVPALENRAEQWIVNGNLLLAAGEW